MPQAKFKFTHSDICEEITVDLLPTLGVKAWMYAVELNDKKRNIDNRYWQRIRPWDDNVGVTLFDQIKELLHELSDTEFKYTGVMPAQHQDIDRNFLNLVHRHFTHSCQRLWSGALRFANNQEQYHLNETLLTLNNCIHNLEHLIPTNTQKKWQTQGQEILICPVGNNLGFDIFPYAFCHSRDHYDLILDPYILGKTLMQSFLDEDDPSDWDTAGHARTAGGCMFVLDDHRQLVYQSQDFVDWLAKSGLNYYNTRADFPLGNLVPGDRERLMEFNKDPLFRRWDCNISIEF